MLKKVLIFPTDTVYGIGASIYDKESIKKIYEIKGRDFNKPLAVLCSSIEQVNEFAVLTKQAKVIAEGFWPGGLTLILKTNKKYYDLTKEETIGVRMPNHKLALSLLDKYGPLKTTSVNTSGEEPLNDYEIIYEKYHDVVSDIYQNNESLTKLSSTVIDLTSDNYQILREGHITREDILKVLDERRKLWI